MSHFSIAIEASQYYHSASFRLVPPQANFHWALILGLNEYKKRQLLDEYGVRLNIIGDIDLLPSVVQAAVKKAENMTQDNNTFVSISSGLIPWSKGLS